MLRKKFHLFSCTVGLVLLFGCAPGSKTNDFQSLVFPDDCENVCWMGIEPRLSTTDESIRILESIYGSENITSENSREGSGVITWNADNSNWDNRGIVFIRSNIVDFVLVWFPENRVEVQDVTAQVGHPDSVGLVISGPVVKCAGAALLYPHIGLLVHLSPADESVGVSEAQNVTGFDIHPPWAPDDFPWTDTAIVPWDGYREYCPEKWPWEK